MNKIDRLGVIAASLCAVHCVIVAFFPWILTALGVGLLATGWAEWLSTAAAIAVAGIAFVLGFQKHRSLKLAPFFIAGAIALLASRFIEESLGHHAHGHGHQALAHEAEAHGHGLDIHVIASLVGVTGGLLIAWGHFQSLRILRKLKSEA